MALYQRAAPTPSRNLFRIVQTPHALRPAPPGPSYSSDEAGSASAPSAYGISNPGMESRDESTLIICSGLKLIVVAPVVPG